MALKKAVKANKTVKAASKKAAGKSVAKKSKAKKAKKAKSAVKGCCTLTGSGPDIQIEGITKEDCRNRAIAAGKNDHWVPGKCAEPS